MSRPLLTNVRNWLKWWAKRSILLFIPAQASARRSAYQILGEFVQKNVSESVLVKHLGRGEREIMDSLISNGWAFNGSWMIFPSIPRKSQRPERCVDAGEKGWEANGEHIIQWCHTIENAYGIEGADRCRLCQVHRQPKHWWIAFKIGTGTRFSGWAAWQYVRGELQQMPQVRRINVIS